MSEKSLSDKLQIKPGRTVLLVGAPQGYAERLAPLPAGAQIIAEPAGALLDIIQVFTRNRGELERELPRLPALLKPGGMIWVTYYKGGARVKTDINRDTINSYAQALGLIGIAIISIDEDWSGLRLKRM